MTEIVLSEGQQDALRRLLALETTPGALPSEEVLDIVALLVPCDPADGLLLGFRSGSAQVVQLAIERYARTFSEGDLAMLRMIAPALQRLMRTQPAPALPSSLTTTERRVLQLVATGRSNAEIAADLYVSVATVRKHLENAYRKLGVHSRMAAVVALGGSPRGRTEDLQPVERYA